MGQTCKLWATADDLCYPCTSDLPFDDATITLALTIASDVLYNLTRRQWGGQCTETVRPPGSRCPFGAAGLFVGKGRYVTSDGVPVGGMFHRTGSVLNDRDTCGCGWVSTIQLPGSVYYNASNLNDPLNPVVYIDGVAVPPSEYRIDDHKQLVGQRKADGTLRIWPVCQLLDLPDGEIGTWHITYTHGRNPPEAGVHACASLACQLLLAMAPPGSDLSKACRLPQRTTILTRQGLTAVMLDPEKLYADGQVGLTEVDMWVQSLHLGDEQRIAAAFDPAQMRRVRRTGR